MDCTARGVTKSQTRLSDSAHVISVMRNLIYSLAPLLPSPPPRGLCLAGLRQPRLLAGSRNGSLDLTWDLPILASGHVPVPGRHPAFGLHVSPCATQRGVGPCSRGEVALGLLSQLPWSSPRWQISRPLHRSGVRQPLRVGRPLSLRAYFPGQGAASVDVCSAERGGPGQ